MRTIYEWHGRTGQGPFLPSCCRIQLDIIALPDFQLGVTDLTAWDLSGNGTARQKASSSDDPVEVFDFACLAMLRRISWGALGRSYWPQLPNGTCM
jgi:hypothetical protein